MNRDYKCRFGGNCYVGRTTENLKQVCQACRFQQCIQAGMKLDCEYIYCMCSTGHCTVGLEYSFPQSTPPPSQNCILWYVMVCYGML